MRSPTAACPALDPHCAFPVCIGENHLLIGQVRPTDLAADACWTLGPFEGRLASLQHARDGGAMRRVALRDLFRRRT